MRKYIEIRSQYDFPSVEIMAEENASAFYITRYSYNKIPKNKGYIHQAKSHFTGGFKPVIVDD